MVSDQRESDGLSGQTIGGVSGISEHLAGARRALANISSHYATAHSINDGTRSLVGEIDSVLRGEAVATADATRREQQTTASIVAEIGRVLNGGAVEEAEPSREWTEITTRDDSSIPREETVSDSPSGSKSRQGDPTSLSPDTEPSGPASPKQAEL